MYNYNYNYNCCATYHRYTSPCLPIPSCQLRGDIERVTFPGVAKSVDVLGKRSRRRTHRVCHITTSFKFITGVSSRLSPCLRITNPFCSAQNSAIECQDSTSLNELDNPITSVFKRIRLEVGFCAYLVETQRRLETRSAGAGGIATAEIQQTSGKDHSTDDYLIKWAKGRLFMLWE